MFDSSQDLWPLLQEAAKAVFAAAGAGNWSLVVALALMAVVAAARKYGAKYVPFLGTDTGGVLTLLAMSVVCGVANALVAGGAMSWGLLLTALGVAWKAAGGFVLLKKLAALALPLLPSWLRGPLELVLGLLGAGKKAEALAKEAGAAAVKAKPATGITGIVGAVKKWPPPPPRGKK